MNLDGLEEFLATFNQDKMLITLVKGTSERVPFGIELTNLPNNLIAKNSILWNEVKSLSQDLDLSGMTPHIKSNSRFLSFGSGINNDGLTAIPSSSFIFSINPGDIIVRPVPPIEKRIEDITPFTPQFVTLPIFRTITRRTPTPATPINFNGQADIRYFSNTGKVILPDDIQILVNQISSANARLNTFTLTLGVNANNPAKVEAANIALQRVQSLLEGQSGRTVTTQLNITNDPDEKGFFVNAQGTIPGRIETETTIEKVGDKRIKIE